MIQDSFFRKGNDFFHPAFTVAIGVAPIPARRARGVYRREGISPDPEVPSLSEK